jgi:hypothetical protein
VLAFFRDRLLNQLPHAESLAVVTRQKDVAHAVLTGRRQADAESVRDFPKEPIGRLNQNASAVAGVGLTAARAAMLQVDEHLEPALDDSMRTLSFDVDNEADAARVMLEARVIQALGLRRCGSK